MDQLTVGLGERSYDIVVGDGLLARAGEIIAPHVAGDVCIISDRNVAELHLDTLRAALESSNIVVKDILLEPGESTKSFSVLESLLNQLLDLRPERSLTLIALGGGVIGDITGFAASILLRGVSFIQIPTTLLSMVDSSVGGKTGINMSQGKNLVGSFYQPKLVLADVSLLSTLPKREFLSGYAEIIKYGLLRDAALFEMLEGLEQKVAEGNLSVSELSDLVIRSCKIKAEIVSEDERESGVRALLNLGHTFGHALEAETGFSDTLLHGEAVAIGMILASELSLQLGWCKEEEVMRITDHIASVGLPSLGDIITHLSVERIIGHMYHDKKVKQGKLVLILMKAIGEACIAEDIEEAQVKLCLDTAITRVK